MFIYKEKKSLRCEKDKVHHLGLVKNFSHDFVKLIYFRDKKAEARSGNRFFQGHVS